MKTDTNLLIRLQECQQAAKSIHGELYQDKISEYMNKINEKRQGKGILLTVSDICKEPAIESSGIEGIMYMAAGLELIKRMP